MGRLLKSVTLLSLVGLLTACGGATHRHVRHRHAHPAPRHGDVAPQQHATGDTRNVWKTPLPPDARLDRRSPELVHSLVAMVHEGEAANRPPYIDINTCAPHIYSVGPHQADVHVSLLHGGRPGRQSLQAALRRVPMPSRAHASQCSDATIVVKQPSTNKMWELWHATRDGHGWRADWGGATDHLSTDNGVYGPNDWPGARTYWGDSASSMTLAGGLLRPRELERGEVDHAIALSIPESAANVVAAPAQRTDGRSHASDAIPYGARFRLDPRVDVDALHVPAMTKVLARAAQRYGLIVREQTSYDVKFTAVAPPPGHAGIYQRIFDGWPAPIMRAFPWDKLQLLRMHLRTVAPGGQIVKASSG